MVFPSTFDGRIYAFAAGNGDTIWTARAPGGINACPSIADGLLLVPVGVPRAGGTGELLAFGLRQ